MPMVPMVQNGRKYIAYPYNKIKKIVDLCFSRHEMILNRKLYQASKITLVHSYLLAPQAAGQVKILIFLVKKNPHICHYFCDAGQVPILRNFEGCLSY